MEVELSLPEDDGDIAPDLGTQIYRIVQEALGNAHRHGQAGHAHVQLVVGDELSLTIEDDGRGFDPATASEGNGLANINSRARTWGGEAEVESQLGRGAFVYVSFPLMNLR